MSSSYFELVDECPRCESDAIEVDGLSESGICYDCGLRFGGANVWKNRYWGPA